MKHAIHIERKSQHPVAPLAGAWIETLRGGIDQKLIGVAPLAGAWIETEPPRSTETARTGSHPSRVRGLKPEMGELPGLSQPVAPLAGAWIETKGYV